jgi:hypothetical protein
VLRMGRALWKAQGGTLCRHRAELYVGTGRSSILIVMKRRDSCQAHFHTEGLTQHSYAYSRDCANWNTRRRGIPIDADISRHGLSSSSDKKFGTGTRRRENLFRFASQYFFLAT